MQLQILDQTIILFLLLHSLENWINKNLNLRSLERKTSGIKKHRRFYFQAEYLHRQESQFLPALVEKHEEKLVMSVNLNFLGSQVSAEK